MESAIADGNAREQRVSGTSELAALETLRSLPIDSTEQQRQISFVLAVNAEWIAEQDARRVRAVTPPPPLAAPFFAPLEAVSRNSPEKAELCGIENTLEADLAALRTPVSPPKP